MDLPVLGIDVSQKTLDAVLLSASGRSWHRQFPNTTSGFARLAEWLKRSSLPCVHVCLEATGTYGQAVALYLYQAGQVVSVVNPAQIHAFAQSELARNKTDKLSAGVIARFCQAHRPQPWSPLPPELAQLQALVRRFEVLQRMRQEELNRLESTTQEVVRSSITQHVEFLDRQIAQAKQAIRDHFDSHPQLRARRDLLVSITSIGEQTAATLLAEIPNLEQFSSSKQVAAFVGMNPRHWQSGSSVHGRPRLSKIGSPRVRKALYMPALSAIRYNPIVRHLAHRLAKKGKQRMLIVGAAMRKLLSLAYGVLKTRRPFDPAFVGLSRFST